MVECFMRSLAAVIESWVGRVSRLDPQTDDSQESVHTEEWQGAANWAVTMTMTKENQANNEQGGNNMIHVEMRLWNRYYRRNDYIKFKKLRYVGYEK